MWLFYYFNFERNYDVLKDKECMHFVEQKYNFNKNKTEAKMENPTQF